MDPMAMVGSPKQRQLSCVLTPRVQTGSQNQNDESDFRLEFFRYMHPYPLTAMTPPRLSTSSIYVHRTRTNFPLEALRSSG